MARHTQGRISKTSNNSGERLNTIGMSKKDLDTLLGSLDTPCGKAFNRKFSRWQYRLPNVEMLLRHASGSDLSMRVACRNLSCGGAAVLHNAYVHLETPCTLMLPKRGGDPEPIVGQIVRCMHKQGIVHELGIRFNTPIRVRDYCGSGPMVDRFSFEQVDPSTLVGTALVVSDSELQHKMLGMILQETQVRLRFARTCAAAMNENLGSVDIVLADWKLPDGRGHSLLMNLRSVGCTAPVVMAIPGNMDVNTNHDGVAPEAYIRLPLKPNDVIRAVAEFLLMPDDPETHTGGDTNSAEDVIAAVENAVASLAVAIKANDGIGCYSMCMTLRDLAEGSALGQVSALASQAALALGDSLDLVAAKAQVEALLSACKDIGGGAAA